MNREEYLLEAVEQLRPDFIRVGAELPKRIRASCGWPSKGALAAKKKRVGECWSATCSGDETFELFISPALKDSIDVMAVLVHEACHAAVGVEAKHGSAFKKVAKALGLEGKMTETNAGDALKERLNTIVDIIGNYPHAELKHSNAPKKQTTRLLKVACTSCECVVRMSRKCLDEAGLPTCGCGSSMEESDV
jgi:hypothetical protein